MALVRASRLKLWKTKPSRSLRMRASSGSRSAGDIDALEEVMAAGRLVEAAENVHQRRFARARRAHDGDELAGLDGEADAAQRFDLDIADDERAGDILDLDDRRRRSGSLGAASRHHLIGAAAADWTGRSPDRRFRR